MRKSGIKIFPLWVSVYMSVLILLISCSKQDPDNSRVRFRNIMIDKYEFPYGLNFGDAVYAGSLGYNDETEYIETTPGPYHIYAKRVDGEWIQISEGKFHVLPGL